MAEMNEPGAPPAKPVPPTALPTPTPIAGAAPMPASSEATWPRAIPMPPPASFTRADATSSKSPMPFPEPAKPERRERDNSGAALAVCVLLFILVALGAAWLWRAQATTTRRVATLETLQQAADPAKMTVLEDQIRTLRQRLTELEQRPAPAPLPLLDLRPLQGRIAALEQRPAVPAPDPELAGKLSALTTQTDALAQKLTQAQSQASAAADQAARTQRLQSAAVALAAGKPLGSIPEAAPALARFATDAPPTEAALRLSFADAASAAQAASHPDLSGQGFASRMWVRAQALVTVKQGDRVLVGTPAAGALASAGQRLQAGDLAGALGVLDSLDPAAAKAMAPWREQAQSLLDARAALASAMAGQAHG